MVLFFKISGGTRSRALQGKNDPRRGTSGGSQGPRQPGKTVPPDSRKKASSPPSSKGPPKLKQTPSSDSSTPKASGSKGVQSPAGRSLQSSPVAHPKPVGGKEHKVLFGDSKEYKIQFVDTSYQVLPPKESSAGKSSPHVEKPREQHKHDETASTSKQSSAKKSPGVLPDHQPRPSTSGSHTSSSSAGSRRSSHGHSKHKKRRKSSTGQNRKRSKSKSRSSSQSSSIHGERPRVSFGYAVAFEDTAEASASSTVQIMPINDSAGTSTSSISQTSPAPQGRSQPVTPVGNHQTPGPSILLNKDEKPQKTSQDTPEGELDAPLYNYAISKIGKRTKNHPDEGVLQEHLCTPRIIAYIMAAVVFVVVVIIIIIFIQGLRNV